MSLRVFNPGPGVVVTAAGTPIGRFETATVPTPDARVERALARGYLTLIDEEAAPLDAATASPPAPDAPTTPTGKRPGRGRTELEA